MTKDPTSKSKYPSPSGSGFVTDTQYIAETVCANKIRNDGKEVFASFWRNSEYSQYFKSQLRAIKKLKELYSSEAIIAFLKTPTGKKCYSLRPKWVEQYIAKEHDKILKKEEVLKSLAKLTEETAYGPKNNGKYTPVAKKTLFSKLK